MLELHYSDGYVVTTGAVADAVMRYAKSLADQKASDLISVPIATPEGPATSSMLIGPASQLYTTPHSGAMPGFDDESWVMELLSRNDRLLHPPVPIGEYPYEEDDPWYEESF
ncbi:hypothetical protein KZX37_04290 [Microbacterium sp. EYE_5]|uniref:hypothetical protein n=1 Tax=unclassified Microbacterium TaxID=2609290 RepID=UPI002005AA85|nr:MULTISPECIES: hypothetical protein [unclassified Microbacterium]MCK6079838.1 hypothetical protein [Microbacterium sp. EYE_382]MCK6085109.1 hypothetical protein [Microbacterium sp. EYE_384]MCK6122665.1 hypothetical protein [Microbacterium sp. EYE_80]MCK6125872.1 hypothetical protein [Microbacterium sp. EYE_79]MCK6140793.1 hypothetical protein [Microbacterium sp. EYE_39]